MTEKMGLARVSVILLFAISFTLMGYLAPVIYATYVPSGFVMESHSFTAQDATTNADSHYICFDRTVYQETSGHVFTELYLVSDGNDTVRTEIDSQMMERYFQGGRNQVVTPIALPNELHEGTYKYLLVVQLDMADGRVTRNFKFESNEFEIRDSANRTHIKEDVQC